MTASRFTKRAPHLPAATCALSFGTARGRPAGTVDDPQLLALTHLSNSMDMALLVGDLIPLLDAYIAACGRHDDHERLHRLTRFLQGLSADPEFFSPAGLPHQP